VGEVNFNKINRNIKKESLNTNLIRIVYEELTQFEADEIIKYQGGKDLGDGKVLSNYPKDLDPLYKEKAKGVITLES